VRLRQTVSEGTKIFDLYDVIAPECGPAARPLTLRSYAATDAPRVDLPQMRFNRFKAFYIDDVVSLTTAARPAD
jgi:hypothetical protein